VVGIEWASDQSLAHWLTQNWRLTTYCVFSPCGYQHQL